MGGVVEVGSFLLALFSLFLTVYLEWPRISARFGRSQVGAPRAAAPAPEPVTIAQREFVAPKPERSVGVLRTLTALLLGGLIPSFIIASYVVFMVSEEAGGGAFLLIALLGMIWGVIRLRHKSWKAILSFAGIGVLLYLASVAFLTALGYA